MVTVAPFECSSTSEFLNTSSSILEASWYDVVPTNPLLQFTNEVEVLDSYVMISLSIKINPYELGNPLVDTTLIVVS